MATRHLFPLLPLLILALPACLHALPNKDLFIVDGRPLHASSRGVFVSTNYPLALPFRTQWLYEFIVQRNSRDSDALCLTFRELDLFTDAKNAALETNVVFGTGEGNPLLTYSGEGSLLRSHGAEGVVLYVLTKPDHLLNGPLCFTTTRSYTSTYTVSVRNFNFVNTTLGRMNRFLADYAAVLFDNIDGNSSVPMPPIHRCLNNTYVSNSARCNSVIDCQSPDQPAERPLYKSDFFATMSSDESFEHARCNTGRDFGTSFAFGQRSAHRVLSERVQQLCRDTDHSRIFAYARDPRDCSLEVQLKSDASGRLPPANTGPLLQLRGIEATAWWFRAACYRFYWWSSSFNSTQRESLVLAEPDGGRVLLRLPGRRGRARWDQWDMVEVQFDPAANGQQRNWLEVLAAQSQEDSQGEWNRQFYLDDLSAEPTTCDDSAYESRMPTMCSFEWSTCGWSVSQMIVVPDTDIARRYSCSFTDHTSENVPHRTVPPSRQHVLQLLPGTSGGYLRSQRRLPVLPNLCLRVWFYGVGENGRSFRFQVGEDSAIVPSNKWHMFSSLVSVGYWSWSLSIKFQAASSGSSKLNVVLLDDVSINEDDNINFCDVWRNGTVHCGLNEWRCANAAQCIANHERCDGIIHCPDSSDQMNCPRRRGDSDDLSFVLRVILGVAAMVLGIVAVTVCLRKRRVWCRSRATRDRENGVPSTVTDGRLPGALRSDRLRDMPPSYADVARGAENAGFAVEEEPPKYEEIAHMFQQQQEQEQQPQQQPQQQQQEEPPPLPPRTSRRNT